MGHTSQKHQFLATIKQLHVLRMTPRKKTPIMVDGNALFFGSKIKFIEKFWTSYGSWKQKI